MTIHNLPAKISVIMPAFNEEATIQEAIKQTSQVLKNCDYEIIVVDDGSTDRTYEAAQAMYEVGYQVKVVTYFPNQGKGYALLRGFEYSTGDIIVFLDADLDLPPQQIWKLYEGMQNTNADVVIGCKHHPDSKLEYPWHRQILSAGYYALVKFLFGLPLRDTQTGLKLFRREVLARVYPRVRIHGFAYDLELLIAALRFGYRIAEIPVQVIFHDRQKTGRIGLQTATYMWLDTLRIFYRASFWEWLQPTSMTRFWMVTFVAGLIMGSFGLASGLTFAQVPTWATQFTYYLTLKFIPHLWRNLLLVIAGGGLVIVALVQLNKSLMKAFARNDNGGLAGIIRISPPKNQPSPKPHPQSLNVLEHPSGLRQN